MFYNLILFLLGGGLLLFPLSAPQGLTVHSDQTNLPDWIEIASLDISAPIVYPANDNDAELQQALGRGAVHYPGTAKIGHLGNAFVFGHSSDLPWRRNPYASVFARLPDIKSGDEIKATDRKGTVYIYQVIETRVIAADDLSVLDQYGFERKLLTLQTSYPIGTALKRFIVIAEIMENKNRPE